VAQLVAATSTVIRVTTDMRWVHAWIRVSRWAAYVIGPSRAMTFAEWGARRLVRVRLDDGPWEWLRADR